MPSILFPAMAPMRHDVLLPNSTIFLDPRGPWQDLLSVARLCGARGCRAQMNEMTGYVNMLGYIYIYKVNTVHISYIRNHQHIWHYNIYTLDSYNCRIQTLMIHTYTHVQMLSNSSGWFLGVVVNCQHKTFKWTIVNQGSPGPCDQIWLSLLFRCPFGYHAFCCHAIL